MSGTGWLISTRMAIRVQGVLNDLAEALFWHELLGSLPVKKGNDGKFHPVEGFEPCNLIWSHSFGAFIRISPGMTRHCFVGRVLEGEPSQGHLPASPRIPRSVSGWPVGSRSPLSGLRSQGSWKACLPPLQQWWPLWWWRLQCGCFGNRSVSKCSSGCKLNKVSH